MKERTECFYIDKQQLADMLGNRKADFCIMLHPAGKKKTQYVRDREFFIVDEKTGEKQRGLELVKITFS